MWFPPTIEAQTSEDETCACPADQSVSATFSSVVVFVLPLQELLQEAAKARIARMTKPKRKRTDLNVPQFVIDKWNSGTSSKDEMAELLMRVNNDKEHVIHIALCMRPLNNMPSMTCSSSHPARTSS